MSWQGLSNGDRIPQIDGYQVTATLFLGVRTMVYRAVRLADGAPVVLKMLRGDRPAIQDTLRLRNHYTIAKKLNLSGVVRPIGLESFGNSLVLVMPDERSVTLQDYIATGSLDLANFLPIAVQLAEILDGLYQLRTIHRDIKPSNILIDPTNHQVKLTDFGLASLLPQETQALQTPNILEGTLAYLSPEQTGRMNRGIDYRTDFYSLGVTFYQLLCGQLPFQSDDPLELVYSHLARSPIPLESPHIPKVLSDIVMKLMAKNAEDRYQSAVGLKTDLEICLEKFKKTGAIADFVLGQVDDLARFNIPQKLYGRQDQIKTLLEVFDRISQGSCELVLVSGYSGVGKTKLIHELLRSLTRQKGYFITGKFDQFKRDIPLDALMQAWRGLIRQLLTESQERLQYWREALLKALGANARVIVDVIPELALIIGQQPPVPELGAIETRNRTIRTLNQFTGVFQSPNHPVVVFMDDVQWIDIASCQSFQGFIQNPENHHWLTIAAYRDNEVSSVHPFMQTVAEMRKAGVTVTEIELEPLDLQDVTKLLAETLHTSVESVALLAVLLFEKTAGNPFFLTQLLKSLYEEGSIWFEVTSNHQKTEARLGAWQWNLARIQQQDISENVVDLMIGKITQLSKSTQKILQLAACIGNPFDLHMLATVSERSLTQTAQELWEAIQTSLIEPVGEGYRLAQSLNADEIAEALAQGEAIGYRFLHDRIQQAAYSLIAEDQKQRIHLTIGQLLLRDSSTREREEQLFEIVNHLNVGRDAILSEMRTAALTPEWENLATLNLAAGRKAKMATAFGAAIDYLAIGIALLPDDAWEAHYPLALALHQEIAEASCLNADFEQMEQWVNIVLQKAKSLLDTIAVQQILIIGAKAKGELKDSVRIGLQVLCSLGIEFPEQPTQTDIRQAFGVTRSLCANIPPQNLLDLPTMIDPQILAAMEILTALVSAAYASTPALMPLLIFKQVELSIRYGNSPVSVFAYGGYGFILCGIIGDIERGYEFGGLALDLLERLQLPSFKARAEFVFNHLIRHWKNALFQTLPSLREAFLSGLENGNIEIACLSGMAYSCHAYYAGEELTELAQAMDIYRQTIKQYKHVPTLLCQEIYQQTVLNLLGQTDVPYLLNGTILNLEPSLSQLQSNNNRGAFFQLHLNQAILYYLFGKDREAVQTSTQAAQYLDSNVSTFLVPLYSFFDALIQLNQYATALLEERPAILDRVQQHQDKLHHWAAIAPTNHQHRYELVAAERYRILDNKTDAIEAYDRAIASAKENKFIQDEALANELTAKFFLCWGKPKAAAGYMQEAYDCYRRWGAKAKLVDLETRYPQLLTSIVQNRISSIWLALDGGTDDGSDRIQARSSSSSSTSILLDLNTVLKASQAIFQEIHLEKLLAKLMHIVMENTGAQTGMLILKSHEDWRISVRCSTDESCYVESLLLEGNQWVPLSAINYVIRTQEVTVIDDVAMPNPFTSDPYWLNRSCKSVFCCPILNQGKLIGVLYLENQITAGAFTRDRQELMQLIAAQAAISIENAQLYQTLEQKVEERTQELSQALSDLQATQAELIQSEKMAALGQLTASVAHEINTPLGVIRCATGNIVTALTTSLQQLPAMLQQLSLSQQTEFLDLVNAAIQNQKQLSLSTQEERQLRRQLQIELSERGFNDAPGLATKLTLLNVGRDLHLYQHILQDPNCLNILQLAYSLVMQQQNANNIQQEVDRAAKIVFALKTYSHRSKLGERSLTQITESIEVALTLYHNRLKQGIEVIRCYAEIPPIFCDPDELTQVWVNLIDNAIYAMGQQGTLEVVVTQRADRAIAQIIDSGSGIPLELQAKIFEPFVTTKPRGEGSGLGLDIVRQIVQKHDGEIEVQSQPGRTMFSVSFPLADT
ncbi:AAA family ATPase [Tumidithrix helvetica PCC 7403]|uniref:trifunctional serine/threonine-protein kinase/ATP-binding protein/sensor histidine kinase n=1 Tax=Tumidithrix helvetica TaxID=3457545 RepID=UPI003CAD0268